MLMKIKIMTIVTFLLCGYTTTLSEEFSLDEFKKWYIDKYLTVQLEEDRKDYDSSGISPIKKDINLGVIGEIDYSDNQDKEVDGEDGETIIIFYAPYDRGIIYFAFEIIDKHFDFITKKSYQILSLENVKDTFNKDNWDLLVSEEEILDKSVKDQVFVSDPYISIGAFVVAKRPKDRLVINYTYTICFSLLWIGVICVTVSSQKISKSQKISVILLSFVILLAFWISLAPIKEPQDTYVSIKNMKSAIFAAKKGSYCFNWLKQNGYQVKEFENIDDAYNQLLQESGNVDAVLHYSVGAMQFYKSHKNKVYLLCEERFQKDYCFIGKNASLIERVNYSLRTLKNNEKEYYSIIKKCIDSEDR